MKTLLLLVISALLLPPGTFAQSGDAGYEGWQVIWSDPYGGPGHIEVRYKVERDKYGKPTLWSWQFRHNFGNEVKIDYRRKMHGSSDWNYNYPHLKPGESGGGDQLGVDPQIEILGVTMKIEVLVNGKTQDKWLVLWSKGGPGSPPLQTTPPTTQIVGNSMVIFDGHGHSHYYGPPRWVGGSIEFLGNGKSISIPPHWQYGEPIPTPSN